MRFKNFYSYFTNDLLFEFSEKTIQLLVKKFEAEANEQMVRVYLQDFEKYKNALELKDPFQYKTFNQLELAVDAAKGKADFKNKNKKVESGLDPAEAIADDENLTIFKGDSEHNCVKYGNGYSFCIAARGAGNMYNNYRLSGGSTFYFIFFKNVPKDDPKHIMVLDRTANGWKWTFANNNTQDTTWERVVENFPMLEKYKHLFVNKAMSDEEKGDILLARNAKTYTKNLHKFNELDYRQKMLLAQSGNAFDDAVFDTLDKTLRNAFLSTGANITLHQIKSLSPKEKERYLVRRSIAIPQLMNAGGGGYEFNILDKELPVEEEKDEQGRTISKKTALQTETFTYYSDGSLKEEKVIKANKYDSVGIQHKTYNENGSLKAISVGAVDGDYVTIPHVVDDKFYYFESRPNFQIGDEESTMEVYRYILDEPEAIEMDALYELLYMSQGEYKMFAKIIQKGEQERGFIKGLSKFDSLSRKFYIYHNDDLNNKIEIIEEIPYDSTRDEREKTVDYFVINFNYPVDGTDREMSYVKMDDSRAIKSQNIYKWHGMYVDFDEEGNIIKSNDEQYDDLYKQMLEYIKPYIFGWQKKWADQLSDREKGRLRRYNFIPEKIEYNPW